MSARVVVVGGGIAGTSLGYELSADHEVVVLEAEATPAAHSTGRSAALYVPGIGPDAVLATGRWQATTGGVTRPLRFSMALARKEAGWAVVQFHSSERPGG